MMKNSKATLAASILAAALAVLLGGCTVESDKNQTDEPPLAAAPEQLAWLFSGRYELTLETANVNVEVEQQVEKGAGPLVDEYEASLEGLIRPNPELAIAVPASAIEGDALNPLSEEVLIEFDMIEGVAASDARSLVFDDSKINIERLYLAYQYFFEGPLGVDDEKVNCDFNSMTELNFWADDKFEYIDRVDWKLLLKISGEADVCGQMQSVEYSATWSAKFIAESPAPGPVTE